MRSLTLLSLLAIAVTACGEKAPDSSSGDSTTPATTAAAMPEMTNPHVMGFESGRALDSLGNILGGVNARFGPGDTIFVSVRTVNVTAGAKIEAVLLRGTTKVASDEGIVGDSNADAAAVVPIRLAGSSPWAKGSYQIEIFLDGVSQGLKPIDIE
jgi:hypothetical protein